MTRINSHLQNLKTSYLFAQIQREKEKYSYTDWINLGIGDATEPLSPTVAKAISDASKELTDKQTHKGYPPSNGYAFLREAICKSEYAHLGFDAEEIFIGNGAKGDLVNVQDLFSVDAKIALSDPTYPVYFESNFINGKSRFIYLPSDEKSHWVVQPPSEPCDVVYLCSPNNPTGGVFTRKDLEKWIAYAMHHKAIIVYDAAYKAFITSKDVPRSIFEIEGAKEVAMEISSFSKTAGFTNLRCSYTTISKSNPLYLLWKRRIETTFGGVPYPIQKGAEAVFSKQGQKEVYETLSVYQSNAALLRKGLIDSGFEIYSGVDSPYLWCKTPEGMNSWQFFHTLLKEWHVVVIPGSGFGPSGEGYFRVSSFASQETVQRALSVFAKLSTKAPI